MEKVIINFKDTGVNEINIDLVVKKWNHLWWVSQYKDEYRLIKYLRKDSPITRVKTGISKGQAKELICKLSLVRSSGAFNNSYSYRKFTPPKIKLN